MSRFVNLHGSEIFTALANAPIYRKRGNVRARLALPAEKVVTTLADGTQETINHAKEGDWIITNPSEEQYILSGIQFLMRYASTDEDGVFEARGYIRAIPNPYGEAITINASWGETQTGDAQCMIADVCDEKGENLGQEPYLIGGKEFAETYSQVIA